MSSLAQFPEVRIKHTGLHGLDLLGLERVSASIITQEDLVYEIAYPNTIDALPPYLPHDPTQTPDGVARNRHRVRRS